MLSVTLAGTLFAGMLPAVPASANEGGVMVLPEYAFKYEDQGYHLAWHDEFEGKTLNLDDWNVEAHKAGWVNEELQRYPEADEALGQNIFVKNGNLVIQPVAEKKEDADAAENNLLKNADFSDTSDPDNPVKGWTETIANWNAADPVADAERTIENGSISYDITKVGTEDWNVQLKQTVKLLKGDSYKLTFDVKSSVARTIKAGLMSADYQSWYGGGLNPLETNVSRQVSIEFTMDKTDETAEFFISMGQMFRDEKDSSGNPIPIDTPTSKVTISNLKLLNLTHPDQGKEAYSDYNFTSGRINTENLHNFTYGMFETRARVPKGKGYLPAFWLMAANEDANDSYGVWPSCGEIDMMEVLGGETNVTCGTIHYGNPREQSQGKYTLSGDGDFSEEFHIFRTEWEPGKISWYLDDQEEPFYTVSNWFSTADDGKTLTYPAPFDHDMYVILNLAVGNEWAGYPTGDVISDMANQSSRIRVR